MAAISPEVASAPVLQAKAKAVKEIAAFMAGERFTIERRGPDGKVTTVPMRRNWTAEDVYKHRESFFSPNQVALKTSEKFWNTLRKMELHSEQLVSTFGVQNAAQARELVMEGFQAVYVSGWTIAASGDNGVAGIRPDISVWPFDQLAEWVKKVRGILGDADRQQTFDLMTNPEKVADGKVRDFLVPMVADVESYTGMRLMEMVRLVIEAGGSAVHCEDQTPEEKRCGHLGGKCVVPVGKHIENLLSIRFMADIMGVPLVIIARTDTNGAFLLTNNGDPADHPFLRKVVDLDTFALDPLSEGLSAGTVDELITEGWLHDATYDDKGEIETYRGELTDKATELVAAFDAATSQAAKQAVMEPLHASLARPVMHALLQAKYLRVQVQKQVVDTTGTVVDNTVETLFRYKGGKKAAAARCLAYCEYADILWVETKVPDLEEARFIAEAVHARYPTKLLAYNLSPSFNWKKFMKGKYGEKDWEAYAARFTKDLATFGYKYQFITLGGHHANEEASASLARGFRDEGMLGYAKFQASETGRFKEHQKYAGVPPFDDRRTLVTGSTEQSAGAGKSFTGTQFH